MDDTASEIYSRRNGLNSSITIFLKISIYNKRKLVSIKTNELKLLTKNTPDPDVCTDVFYQIFKEEIITIL